MNSSFIGRITWREAAAHIQVPEEALPREYSARPVIVRHGSHKCRARVIRSAHGCVVLILTARQADRLALSRDALHAALDVTVMGERLHGGEPSLPSDIAELRGVDWASVSERDRHQALVLINEALTADVRAARIAALVCALRSKR